MEHPKSLSDYLKYSKAKRSNILKIANEFFDQVIKEEERKVTQRRGYSRENSYTLQKTRAILEPIHKRSTSRALTNENKPNFL